MNSEMAYLTDAEKICKMFAQVCPDEVYVSNVKTVKVTPVSKFSSSWRREGIFNRASAK